jgi:hypothetical protein
LKVRSFALSFVWSLLILAIGTWWSYLLLNSEEGTKHQNDQMGGATFSTPCSVSGCLFVFRKKNKACNFSSMTHELKTPQLN